VTLTDAREHIGDGVVYHPRRALADIPLAAKAGAMSEDGTIVSAGESYAFVLYAGDRYPKATDPADLTLLAVTT
jgi:hypothetical protein